MSLRSNASGTGASASGVDARVLVVGALGRAAAGVVAGLRRSSLRCSVVGVEPRSTRGGSDAVSGSDADPLDVVYAAPDESDDEFRERIREIVARESIDVVVPTRDGALAPLAADRAALAERGARATVPDPSVLAVVADAGRRLEYLEERRFAATPSFERAADRAAFVDAVERLGYPDDPVRVARAGAGESVVCTPAPSRSADDGETEAPRAEAVTSVEALLTVLEDAGQFPELVVTACPPGAEYAVDVVATAERVPAVIPRSLERDRSGRVVAGTVERREHLIAVARAIALSLDLEYNATLRFRVDDAGEPTLVDVTPRVTAGVVAGLGAGANLPAMAVRHALGRRVREPDVAWGTTMRRYSQGDVAPGPRGR